MRETRVKADLWSFKPKLLVTAKVMVALRCCSGEDGEREAGKVEMMYGDADDEDSKASSLLHREGFESDSKQEGLG